MWASRAATPSENQLRALHSLCCFLNDSEIMSLATDLGLLRAGNGASSPGSQVLGADTTHPCERLSQLMSFT